MPDPDVLHIIGQLQDAATNRDRAAILMRVPDAIVDAYADPFARECRRFGFEAGAEFVTMRRAILHMVRDEHGLLPQLAATSLEQARIALSHFAAGADVPGLG